MNSTSLSEIKFDLKRTKRAIVAIGCSFVQGSELDVEFDLETRLKGKIKNQRSFVNLLCKKYFENHYTPINFGREAGGNFGAISRLFLYDIPWGELDEIVLIFMPTGMQRFDIIRDDVLSHVGNDFKTLWPFLFTPVKDNQDWINFNKGYEQTVHSDRFEVLNAILNFQFLNAWIYQYKPKFLIFPAFSTEYNKEYFTKTLQQGILRASYSEKIKDIKNHFIPTNSFNYSFLIDSVPWDKFITIDGSRNFFDLCFKNDKNYHPKLDMQSIIDKKLISNNEWIMPRGHPSPKGHDFLAEHLFRILSKS